MELVTIKDIAEKTNLSSTTVSRVLNHDDTLSISEEKKKLIFEVAAKLDYKTPRNRNKKKKKLLNKYKLGIIHFLTLHGELEDPYYVSIRLGIEQQCKEENIEITNIYQGDSFNEYNELKKFNALIIIGRFPNSEIEKIEIFCKNIVFVDSSPFQDKYDSVVIDIERAVIKALDYMIEKKYSTIGYIGGKEVLNEYNTPLGEKRSTVFRNYLSEKNMFSKENFYISDFSYQSGYEIMKKALEKPSIPKIFFTGNDNIAIGALKALYEKGIKVPDEVAIIGFNDIPTAHYTTPPLSTIKIFSEFMGETAVKLVVERIEGRAIAKKIIVPTKLILRGTTKS